VFASKSLFIAPEKIEGTGTTRKYQNHYTLNKESLMNKDQLKGTVKEAAGKTQEKAGQVLGDREQQAKGQQKQGEAKVDKVVGGVKDVFNK